MERIRDTKWGRERDIERGIETKGGRGETWIGEIDKKREREKDWKREGGRQT